MAQSSGTDVILIKSEGGINDSLLSDEHENLPLKVRMKCKPFPVSSDHKSSVLGEESKRISMPHIDVVVKKEDDYYNSQGVFSFPVACFADNGKGERLSQEQNHAGKVAGVTTELAHCKTSLESGATDLCSQNATSSQHVVLPRDWYCQGTLSNACIRSDQMMSAETSAAIVGPEKVNAEVCTLPQHPTLFLGKVKVEYFDDNLMSSFGDSINGSAGADVHVVRVKKEIPDVFADDDLDHIILKERQRMLLPRKLLGVAKSILEGNSGGSSNPVMENLMQHNVEKGKEESQSVDGKSSMAGSSDTTLQSLPLVVKSQGIESTKSKDFDGIPKSDMMCSYENTSTEFISCGEQNLVLSNYNSNVSPALPASVKVKVEPFENNLQSTDKKAVVNLSFNNKLTVKNEMEIPADSYGDEIDHMSLRDRIKLLMPKEVFDLNISRNYECSRKTVPSPPNSRPAVLESFKPTRVNRLRKRKKTATDSVETALEEDAPGLLQVLTEKGVFVDEIRLYGEIESDDAMDDSSNEDSFSELEAVISKLFSRHHSLLKFAPIRCTKGSKASYCLACLISLVEQTRYLQFRKWPVEWGWCRDLQSFIFVFERHNRIVLERPEYGYATYFFELEDSLPIDWQIKRLVIAMKLTSCSRVTLIENKALLVGEDLTEGEARVLMEYGWSPNSGLGTMLNYCDRVVHDRKIERESSEWKSKIGKLLMDGYNGGTIVSSNIPKKVLVDGGSQNPQIKLEL